MISHEYRFIFVHAGRTGGSTFERMAGIGLTDDERTRALGNTDFPEKHNDFEYYRSHYPVDFDKYFKFTIVRNPFDRLCSGWLWQTRVVQNLPPISLYEFIATRPSSHTFAEKFRLEGMTIEEAVRKFDYIGRFEDLTASYAFLCDRLKIPGVSIPHTNKTPAGRYQDAYDEETIALVLEKYGTDLELFGYKFDPVDSNG